MRYDASSSLLVGQQAHGNSLAVAVRKIENWRQNIHTVLSFYVTTFDFILSSSFWERFNTSRDWNDARAANGDRRKLGLIHLSDGGIVVVFEPRYTS
jgi:hypothetical protein